VGDALLSAAVTANPKDRQLAIRMSEEDYEWLRAEAERLQRELGLNVSMGDVIRRLIRDARAAAETPRKRPR
jgi:hypothetical protein